MTPDILHLPETFESEHRHPQEKLQVLLLPYHLEDIHAVSVHSIFHSYEVAKRFATISSLYLFSNYLFDRKIET